MNRSLHFILATAILFALPGPFLQAGETVRVVKSADVKLGDKVLAHVTPGQTLVKINENGDWIGVEVRKDGQLINGWIFKDAVETVAGTKTPAAPRAARPAGNLKPLLTLRIRSVNHLLKEVQTLLMQVQPMFAAMASADALVAFLPPQLQASIKQGIDFDRPVALVVYPPEDVLGQGKPNPDVCVLVPIKSRQAAEGLPVQSGAVEILDQVMLVGNRQRAVDLALQDFGKVPQVDVADMKSDLNVVLHMDTFNQAMGVQFDEELQKALARKNDPASSPKQVKKAKTQILGIGLAKALFADLVQSTYDLDFTPQGIRSRSAVSARPGSVTAVTIQSMSQGKAPDISGRLPRANVIALGSFQFSGKELSRLVLDLADRLIETHKGAGRAEELEIFEEVRRRFGEIIQKLEGNLAFAVPADVSSRGAAVLLGSGSPELLANVKDLVRYIVSFEEGAQANLEQVLTENIRQHRGTAVDRLHDPNEEVSMELAQVNDLIVLTLGKEPGPLTDQVIDSTGKPGGGPAMLSQAARYFTGKRLGIVSLYLMKLLAEIEKSENGGQAGIAGNLALSDQPLAMALMAREEQIAYELFVPVQPLKLLQAYITSKVTARRMQKQPAAAGPQKQF